MREWEREGLTLEANGVHEPRIAHSSTVGCTVIARAREEPLVLVLLPDGDELGDSLECDGRIRKRHRATALLGQGRVTKLPKVLGRHGPLFPIRSAHPLVGLGCRRYDELLTWVDEVGIEPAVRESDILSCHAVALGDASKPLATLHGVNGLSPRFFAKKRLPRLIAHALPPHRTTQTVTTDSDDGAKACVRVCSPPFSSNLPNKVLMFKWL